MRICGTFRHQAYTSNHKKRNCVKHCDAYRINNNNDVYVTLRMLRQSSGG